MKKYQLPLKNNYFSQNNPSGITSALGKITTSITPTSKTQAGVGKRTPSNSSNRNNKPAKTESSPSHMPSSVGLFNQESGTKDNSLSTRGDPASLRQFSSYGSELSKKKQPVNPINNISNGPAKVVVQSQHLQQAFGSMINSSGGNFASTGFFPKGIVSVNPSPQVPSPSQGVIAGGNNDLLRGKITATTKISAVDINRNEGTPSQKLIVKTQPEKFVFTVNGVSGFMTVASAKGVKLGRLITIKFLGARFILNRGQIFFSLSLRNIVKKTLLKNVLIIY
jgi:hypothetical protein